MDTPQRSVRAACVQMLGTPDVDRNLATAERLVREAVSQGAELVVLPEKWPCLGEPDEVRAGAEPLDGPTLEAVGSWARELGVWTIGSVPELVEGDERIYNTCVVTSPDGSHEAGYRKIHMFDVDIAGVEYRESDLAAAGREIVVTQAADVSVGLSICYDLRFPELYRIMALQGAELFTLPSAFTMFTGKDHWSVLLRARAIENSVFVAAANAMGDHGNGKVSYGRSMIVDPWGVVIAQASDRECAIVADLDFSVLERVRQELPSLSNRQPDVYAWPGVPPQH